MLTFKEKGVVLGCLLFTNVVIGLFSPLFFVIGLFATIPVAFKVLSL